ncbi:hypothetical protein GF373_08010 [bacterium]|nr:hypothetical protein [bacterium]
MNPLVERLHGLFLPITTPFKEDMAVDYEALQCNMAAYAETDIHGYLALGSNGENRCLSEDEKQQVLKTICQSRRPDQIVMAGCVYDSTVLAVDFINMAQEAGADYATLLAPSYYRKFMTHEVLVEYFSECADAAAIPVLLYNAPGFTGIALEPRTVAELAEHPNILGMKDSAASGIENFCPSMSGEFAVLAGSAGFLYPAMVHYHVPGGIISLANAFPSAGLTLLDYAQQGGSEAGDRFHDTMKTVNKRISGAYGVPGVKAAMDLAGLRGGYPRKPLKRLNEEARADIKQALEEADLL